MHRRQRELLLAVPGARGVHRRRVDGERDARVLHLARDRKEIAMRRHELPWAVMTLAALLFASGCIVSDKSGDAGPDDGGDAGYAGDLGGSADAGDAGDTCADEGRFICGAMTRQCCSGVWVAYMDGPCWPVDGGTRDGGALDCAVTPTADGCPCTAPVAPICGGFRPWRECSGGVWTASGTHACCL
jgi:hypothetical protein